MSPVLFSLHQEKELRACGIPVPDDAGGKKSFSLRPSGDHKDGAGSIGILYLGCNRVFFTITRATHT